MGRRSKFSAQKRRREINKLQKKQDKAERREQLKGERNDSAETGESEDPDLAGIVPGPQPKWYDTNLPDDD